jgi:hypothetical protein
MKFCSNRHDTLQVKQSPEGSSSCCDANEEEERASAEVSASLLRAAAGRGGTDLSVSLPKCPLGVHNPIQGFMFSEEEHDKTKYESPLVRKLREVQVGNLLSCLVAGDVGIRHLGLSCLPC